MDLSTVHNGIVRRKKKKRVGRGPGSGHGKTASRGSKGQWTSAGAGHPSWTFEGGQMPLFRRMPKRGFSHATWDRTFHVVNVGDLNCFEDGTTVDAAVLKEAGLAKGPANGVRVLGTGELTKKLTVKRITFRNRLSKRFKPRVAPWQLFRRPRGPNATR